MFGEECVLRALRREKAVIFERGENARLWDINGRMYLDTMSGSAGPAMVGHANPRVAAAVARQMATLPSVGILHDAAPVIEFCARLARLAPAGLTKTFVSNGGGDAIEAAIKFAIRVTGRTHVLSLGGGYHGASLATMSLGGMPALRRGLPGGIGWPSFRQVPSPDPYRSPLGLDDPQSWRAVASMLQAEMDLSADRVAALLMEIVQGPNGHTVFPAGFYAEAQRLCRERNVLLVVDEIQTGLGRCGTLWACDLFDVRPDILVIGKALGGGVPIGAFLTRPDLVPDRLDSEPWHIQTFMNQPLAAAAALAVLDIVEREQLPRRAQELGARAKARFDDMARRYSVIGDVRGPGLFIGVDFVTDRAARAPATEVCRQAWEFALDRGLLVQFGGAGGNVLKFKPPLTTPDDDFEKMLDLSEETAAFIQQRVERGSGAASP